MDQYVLALKYENYIPVKTASNSYQIMKFLSPSCNILLSQRSCFRRIKELYVFKMLSGTVTEKTATKCFWNKRN